MLSGTLGMCIVQSLLPQFITRRQCRILMISCRFLHLTNHRKNLILIESVWINSINLERSGPRTLRRIWEQLLSQQQILPQTSPHRSVSPNHPLYIFICLSDLNSFCSFVCVSLKKKSIANSTPTIRWISSVDYSTFLDIGKASFFNFSKYFFIFSDQGFNRCTSSSRFIPLSPTLSILTSLRGHFVILIDEDVILVQFYLSVHVRNGDFDAIEFD